MLQETTTTKSIGGHEFKVEIGYFRGKPVDLTRMDGEYIRVMASGAIAQASAPHRTICTLSHDDIIQVQNLVRETKAAGALALKAALEEDEKEDATHG